MSAGAPTTTPADGLISADIDRFSSRRAGGLGGIDQGIAALAGRQHGVVSVAQLISLGLSETAVHQRVEVGRLHRVHQGVYTVGHSLLSVHGRFMAAVLACGPGSVLSHRSAARLWGLREDLCNPIDVIAPNRRGRIPAGISAHRDGTLTQSDRATRHGIPCTTVARTLLDLAGIVPIQELRKEISEAEVLRLLDHRAVRSLIKRSRGRRGVARLRMLIDDIHPETKRTRSELERRFLAMCERTGLPQPEVNVLLDLGDVELQPDFLWRDAGLIVETDGHRYHDTGSARRRDRWREQRLQLAGWRVSGCTWTQVEREPRQLAARIHGLLRLADGTKSGLYQRKSARRRPG
jgi:predicted transcriptional regulator of viral defense system